ncbi:MAG: flagellar basal body rod protein FlgC [Bacillota bacterium]
MKIFQGMATSVSALTAEKLRLDVIAHNLANINTTRGNNGEPFRRKMVLFREVADQALSREKANRQIGRGVRIAAIVEDQATPLRPEYNPSHPDADGAGIVRYPNVELSTELIDLMNAQRSYQINLGVFNTSRQMADKALELGRG